MREAELSNQKTTQGKKKAKCFPRSQHGGSILFHTHKSDQLKIEIHYTLDKQFQTLTKADLGMGISSNLHLVMFHIWTWNVLGEKSKFKKTTHAIALLKYWQQFEKSSEQPWNSRGGGGGLVAKTISFLQYLAFAKHLPLRLKFFMRNLHFIEGLHLKADAMFIPDSNLATTDPLSLLTWENMGHQTANLAIVYHCKIESQTWKHLKET